jgi:hypothetical protein
MYQDNLSPSYLLRNVQVNNNIFFAKNDFQTTVNLSSVDNDLISFGPSDNNYYVRPFDNEISLITSFEINHRKFWNSYDLEGWQEALKKDLNSYKSPIIIPRYSVKKLLGSNKIPGGAFTSHAWDVYAWAEDYNATAAWDNSGKIDGGSLKVSFKEASTTNTMVSVGVTNIGSIEPGKYYLLKFTSAGNLTKRNIGVYLQQAGPPFNKLTPIKYVKLLASRTETEILFSLPAAEVNANVIFQLSDTDGSIWFDNMELYEAEVNITNPDDHLRFEYNASNSAKTLTLDKVYVDAKNNLFQNKLTLAPYSSVVLIATGTTPEKKAQSITFSAIAVKTFGDSSFTLNGIATSGLPVSYEIVSGPATVKDSVVTLTGAGIVTIKATQQGNENYLMAAAVSQSFIVNKTIPVLVFDSISAKTYGDAPFALKASTSSGLAVTYQVLSGPATIANNMVTVNGSGSVIIRASITGDGKDIESVVVEQAFTVNKASQTLSSLNLVSKTYGEIPFALKVSSSSGLPIIYKILAGPATISDSLVTITAAGNVTIEASQPGNVNYNAATAIQQSFTVDKAGQSITFASIPVKTFGDQPFALQGSATSGLPVNFLIVSGPAIIKDNVVTLMGTGVVAIKASQAGDDRYNAAIAVSNSFTVTTVQYPVKIDQTITFETLINKTYGDMPFTLKGAATSGLPVSFKITSGAATIKDNLVTLTGSGSVTIEASQEGNITYKTAASVLQTFEVSKASQTIAFGILAAKRFGDVPFSINPAASSGLPVSLKVVSGPATIAGSLISVLGSGTVTVEASQPGNDRYNPASIVKQSFFVDKATQVLIFEALKNKNYGAEPFALEAKSTSGLAVSYKVVSGPVTINGSIVTLTGSGKVTIEASQAGDENYFPAKAIRQSFSINKSNQNISFASISNKLYNDPPLLLEASLNTAAISDLAISYKLVAGPATLQDNVLTLTGTGIVTVEASQGGDDNYNPASTVQQSFSVSKAKQNISFENIVDKTLGAPSFALTATTSSGLPVSFQVTSGQATIKDHVVTLKGPGTITIEASQNGNDYYEQANAVRRSFTVSSTGGTNQFLSIQHISFESISTKTIGDSPFAVNAISSSGLPIVFKVQSGSATLKDNLVTLTRVGTVIIEASQEGDNKYSPANPVQQSFTVNKSDQNLSFDSIPDKKYGDPPFELKNTARSGLPVSFNVKSGSATIRGNVLSLTGPGTVIVEASQTGNEYYNPSVVITRKFMVREGQSSGIISSSVIINGSPATFVGNTTQLRTYPNPFTGQLAIQFNSTETAETFLRVYDVHGKMIRDLFAGTIKAGEVRNFILDSEGITSGVYIVRVNTPGRSLFQKVILAK